MSYMENQMDNFIQSGVNEREEILTENESLRKENKEMKDLLNTIFLHLIPLARLLDEPYKSGLKSRTKQIEELLNKVK